MTNCPNCGAPVDVTAQKCAYCDTDYRTWQQQPSADDVSSIIAAINEGIITINEARQIMGIEVIEDFEFVTKPMPMEWSD